MVLVKKLQMEVATQIFTPPAVYDGRKNMFAARELPLGATHAKTVGSQFFSNLSQC
jgi:eukaryotic translation initiation factor 2C